MTIRWYPKNGSRWRNGGLEGDGQIIDNNNKKILEGHFNKRGRLDGECIKIDFAGPFVSIRKGNFTAGKEDGNVVEYVFGIDQWEVFLNTADGIEVTKYDHVFDNGQWQQTTSTTQAVIRCEHQLDDNGEIKHFEMLWDEN